MQKYCHCTSKAKQFNETADFYHQKPIYTTNHQ